MESHIEAESGPVIDVEEENADHNMNSKQMWEVNSTISPERIRQPAESADNGWARMCIAGSPGNPPKEASDVYDTT
jgi:hypothetical protein